jgi:ATP-dependent Lhr-like helicase
VKATPILLCEREHLPHWQAAETAPALDEATLSPKAQRVLAALKAHGASFLGDLVHDSSLIRTEVELALGELVSHGLVTADSFAGLRSLVAPAERHRHERRYRGVVDPMVDAGRWALARAPRRAAEDAGALAAPHVEHIARVLLRRYGVVFRRLLEREDHLPPWRELFYVYRRLEARGEIRGGRFVSGFSGEQFALPEASSLLRKVAKDETRERVSISAADPLNLVGILTPGERVPALAGNRVLFEGGVPVAVQSGGEVRYLQAIDEKSQWEIRNLLIRRQRPASYFEPPRAAQ